MIKTIQQPPVPKAGGDLELSVSYVREEMAERHPRVVMNLVEYQWKQKKLQLRGETETERERERRDISATQKLIALCFFCAADLKLRKKNRNFQVHHPCFVFSLCLL